MTPKELCVLIVKEPLVLIGLSSQKVIDIAQAYLNLESRIQKLERVAEAAIVYKRQFMSIDDGFFIGLIPREFVPVATALAELERE